MPTEPVYALTLELAVGSLTNLSSYCERASWSRTIAGLFEPLNADAGTFEFNNSAGSLSPLLNSGLLTGRLLQLQATHGGSTYNLFKGRVKYLATRPTIGERTTVIEALTEVERLNRRILNTGIFTGIRPSSLFTEIMTRAAVQSYAWDATGEAAGAVQDSVPFAWYRDRNAANALEELIRSGHYHFYVDGAGTFQMKNRFFGVGASGVGSHTLDNAFDLNFERSDDGVLNSVKASATPREQISTVSTLAYIAQQITLPASGSVGFWLEFTDPRNVLKATPIGSIVALVSSQDFYAAQNSDGTGTDHTSTLSVSVSAFAESIVCSLFNGTGTDAHLTRFQIRGYPILEGAALQVSTDDSSSQGVYGVSEFTLRDLLMTRYDYVRDLAALVLGEQKEPRDHSTLILKNEFPEVLAYEPGQILSLVDSISGINSMWTVQSARHDVSLIKGLEHSCAYELEFFSQRPWLILDHPTYGKLDSGRQLGL